MATARVDASPTATATPYLPGQPPPNSFDPRSVMVFFNRSATGSLGLWLGPIDGSDWRPVVQPGPETGPRPIQPRLLPDGSVLYVVADTTFSYPLRIVRPDGSSTTLGTSVLNYGVGAGRVFMTRGDSHGRDLGVWSVPLAGGSLRRELPVHTPSQTTLGRAELAVSPDGTRLASPLCGNGVQSILQFRVGGGEPGEIGGGRPLGFDRDGRLIAQSDCAHGAVYRIDIATGRKALLTVPGGIFAELTPDARLLASISQDDGPVIVRDLVTGASRSFPLAFVPTSSWAFVETPSNRYLVLFSEKPNGVTGTDAYAVIDLQEGWVGYIHARRPGE